VAGKGTRLALGTALILVVVGCDGSNPPPTEPPAAAPQKPADPHAEARKQARRWFEETYFDAAGRLLRLSAEKIHAHFAEGERRGYGKIPELDWTAMKKAIYEGLLEREPDDPVANRAFGRVPLSDYPDFFEVFRRLTDARALPDHCQALRDRFEDRMTFAPRRRAPALEPDVYFLVKTALDDFQEFERKLAADPVFRAVFRARKRVEAHPLLGRFQPVHLVAAPFVLFHAGRDEKRLRALAPLLEEFLAFFRERWAKPLSLPEFTPGRLFFVWIFDDRESFDAYGKQSGLIHPPGLLGYFHPREHWVFLCEQPEQRIRLETSLAHEIVHLLHWHFSREHFDRLQATWFEEGWAEYASWFERSSDRYRFARSAPERLEVLRACRENKLPLYPLRRLVHSRTYEDYLEDVMKAWLPEIAHIPTGKQDELRRFYIKVLYAESWLFLRFLYEGEQGKYRAKILEFTRAALRGLQGYDSVRPGKVFEKVFGLAEDADWERFQGEFDRFVEESLA
jgi:hypothetical protein